MQARIWRPRWVEGWLRKPLCVNKINTCHLVEMLVQKKRQMTAGVKIRSRTTFVSLHEEPASPSCDALSSCPRILRSSGEQLSLSAKVSSCRCSGATRLVLPASRTCNIWSCKHSLQSASPKLKKAILQVLPEDFSHPGQEKSRPSVSLRDF